MKPCGKSWFETEEECDVKLHEVIISSDDKNKDLLNSYFCEECEGWHFGHNYKLRIQRIQHLCIGEMK